MVLVILVKWLRSLTPAPVTVKYSGRYSTKLQAMYDLFQFIVPIAASPSSTGSLIIMVRISAPIIFNR